MEKNRRICALTLAVLMLICTTAAGAFIAYEAGHDCSGAECPVCAALAACSGILRLLPSVLPLIAALFAVLCCEDLRIIGPFSGRLKSTPVTMKVLLLN